MSAWTTELKSHFQKLSQSIFSEVKPSENLSLNLLAENTDYIRLNQNKLRQSTSVNQKEVVMTFQSEKRKVTINTSITGDFAIDIQRLKTALISARAEVNAQPESPNTFDFKNHGQSENDFAGKKPSIEELASVVIESAAGCDLAGIIASGPVIRASTNSLGQNHWFSTDGFYADYSLFTVSDGSNENKAVKATYSGQNWIDADFKTNLQNAKNQLSLLRKPSVSIKPGKYRTYLAPGAISEIVGTMGFGAISAKAFKTGHSPFAKLAEGKEKFSPLFSLTENFDLGLSPRFNSLGEMAPERLPLIENGEFKNWITSSQSAANYDLESNAGEVNGWAYEPMRSPEIASGSLAQADVLKELGTGLYLSNLHYLNFSDVATSRITGMTRYACFWVERGEIVAPIKDIRFDESLYTAFGKNLAAVTKETEVEVNTDTYYLRGLGGKKIPGMLINDFNFTL